MSNSTSRDYEWIEDAACRGMDPDKFNVPTGAASGLRIQNLVNMGAQGFVCCDCPVARQCAADALDHNDNAVVRGGIPIPAGDHHSGLRKLSDDALREVAEGTPAGTSRQWWLEMAVDRAQRESKKRTSAAKKRWEDHHTADEEVAA